MRIALTDKLKNLQQFWLILLIPVTECPKPRKMLTPPAYILRPKWQVSSRSQMVFFSQPFSIQIGIHHILQRIFVLLESSKFYDYIDFPSRPTRNRRRPNRLTFINTFNMSPLMSEMLNNSIKSTRAPQCSFKHGDLPQRSDYELYNQNTLGCLNWDSLLYTISSCHSSLGAFTTEYRKNLSPLTPSLSI